MEELVLQFSSLGVAGLVGGVLFKKFLDDDKVKNEERKEEARYYREEIKITREAYQDELRKQREEATKDREIYIDSIEKITNSVSLLNDKVDTIEEDIKDIKTKLDK